MTRMKTLLTDVQKRVILSNLLDGIKSLDKAVDDAQMEEEDIESYLLDSGLDELYCNYVNTLLDIAGIPIPSDSIYEEDRSRDIWFEVMVDFTHSEVDKEVVLYMLLNHETYLDDFPYMEQIDEDMYTYDPNVLYQWIKFAKNKKKLLRK